MKKINALAFGFLLIIILAGCKPSEIKYANDIIYSDEIASFLPESLMEAFGDGGYYHILSHHERVVEDRILRHSAFGEVKRGLSQGQTNFVIETVVDSEKKVMYIPRGPINDSDFEVLVALKLPLALGNEWKFHTKTPFSKIEEVTAKIVEMDTEGKWITVEYTSNKGQIEKRTFTQGLGTTSFSKTIGYKQTVAVTGYRSTRLLEVSKNEKQAVAVEPAIYNFLNAFNRYWILWTAEGEPSIFNVIEKDSLAYEKINAIEANPNLGLTSIEYKIYDVELNEDHLTIYVLEDVYKNDVLYSKNNMRYDLVRRENEYFLLDFILLSNEP